MFFFKCPSSFPLALTLNAITVVIQTKLLLVIRNLTKQFNIFPFQTLLTFFTLFNVNDQSWQKNFLYEPTNILVKHARFFNYRRERSNLFLCWSFIVISSNWFPTQWLSPKKRRIWNWFMINVKLVRGSTWFFSDEVRFNCRSLLKLRCKTTKIYFNSILLLLTKIN